MIALHVQLIANIPLDLIQADLGLLHAIPLSNRDGFLGQGLSVDGDTVGRAGLVLAPVASTNSALLIVEGGHIAFEVAGDDPRAFLARHSHGDWGDLTDADRQLNDEAVEHEGDEDRHPQFEHLEAKGQEQHRDLLG